MFRNVKIKTRLILNTIALIILTVIIGLLGLKGIQIANEGASEVYYGGAESINELNKIKDLYSENIKSAAYKVREDTLSWEQGAAIVSESLSNSTKHMDEYFKTGLTQDEKIKTEHLESILKNVNFSIDKLLKIMKEQDKEKLIVYLKTELDPTLLPIIKEIQSNIDRHLSDTKHDFEHLQALSAFFGNLMILIIIATIIISIIFSFFIIRSITLPLAQTVGIINRLAQGDNAVQIDINSQNEIGEMLSALKIMVESVKKMVVALTQISKGDLTGGVEVRSDNDVLSHSINDMILKLRQMISETQEEIIVIANSAEEVTASVTQVSTGTTETAAAVTETTTTVEELQQTAQVSAEKAQDVLKSSEETLKVVRASELSLKSTIAEMGHIQEKMSVISESIIKLSEHSLTIGDIITSVNELAEQSNLLAVNAAIEAAKAGDQGKGFGVVAQEIRTLAEQSKAATAQIKSILNDIQNATSTAVMATEQGSKAVNKGVAQSSETNTAMQSLLTNISQGTQAAKQISLSSQQQLIGVEQVRMAMSNINQASEQHVEHMRQIETAISSLNDVSKNLKNLISQYKINVDESVVNRNKKDLRTYQTKLRKEERQFT